jgi:probable F420-dependent oxidoreductase
MFDSRRTIEDVRWTSNVWTTEEPTMTSARDNLGTFGVWTGSEEWPRDTGELAEAAAEVEELGFGAVWIGLSSGDLALHERILDATSRLVVASGIVNVWVDDPEPVAASYHRVAEKHPGRFLLGIGAGHAKFVDTMTSQTYRKPLSRVASYLDALDRADPPVPVGERVVAALGPKALRLAAERSAGPHPYNVTPEHTADARAALGPEPLLATEQKVFLGTDPEVARSVARSRLAIYLDLPNYVNNLLRYGFSQSDFAGEGSDRLVDGLVAWGAYDTVASRVQAHLDAGANHVVLQVLSTEPPGLPRAAWRRTAEVLPVTRLSTPTSVSSSAAGTTSRGSTG